MGCLDATAAVDFVEGRLDAGTTDEVEGHVAGCPDCRALIAAAARDTGAGAAAETVHTQAPAEPPAVLGRGTVVGRYVILEPHARGGMGEVYKAFDPELERTVAVKLMRTGRGGGEARVRLVREARALAQLAHPNVVAVHDAGSFGDQVFIAMEFVTGKTVRRWLRDSRPGWRRIVEAMAAAGRGLQAAHDAGLVHRDFKPDNVIVGDDGRVRVLDFGLARADGDPEDRQVDGGANTEPAPPSSSSTIDTPGGTLSARITRTGALLGTPGYMAPEQHLGRPVDARTDQFAFCVALHEALWGERPFPDDGLVAAVLAGQVAEPHQGLASRRSRLLRRGARACEPHQGLASRRSRLLRRGARACEPPRQRDVPARLRKIILRGLAVVPGDRYPSMTALLADLERDPQAQRRRAAAVAGVTGVGALAAVALTIGLRDPPAAGPRPCQGADLALAGIWDDDRRAAVAAGFDAADPARGAEALGHAAPLLDRYAGAWRTMHVATCEATAVRGEQSAEVLDVRMLCLDRRRKSLAAVVDLLVAPDAALVGKATQVAGSLPRVDDCADVAALTAPVPLPHDPQIRAAVDQLTTELARAEALRIAGRFPESLVAAQAVLDRARTIAHPPLLAEAIFGLEVTHGSAGNPAEAERLGEEAVNQALAARHPAIAARAAIELAWTLGVSADRRTEAHRWARIAGSAIASMGGNDELSALLDGCLGSMALYESKTDDALMHLSRAVELERKIAGGADSHQVARALANLAIPHFNLGELDRAGELLREAIEMFRRTLGEHHPILMDPTANLAQLYLRLDRLDDAERFATEAYQLAVATYGNDSEQVARALAPLAVLHDLRGDRAAAEAEVTRRIEILTAQLGPDSGELGVAWSMRGTFAVHRGDAAAAVAHYQRALALVARAYGAQSRELANTSRRIAAPLSRLGRRDEALRHASVAHEIFGALYGDDNLETVVALVGVARIHLDDGRPTTARPLLERALAAADRAALGAEERADAELQLARALARSDPARARALAGAARQRLAAVAHPEDPALRGAIDAWLAAAPP